MDGTFFFWGSSNIFFVKIIMKKINLQILSVSTEEPFAVYIYIIIYNDPSNPRWRGVLLRFQSGQSWDTVDGRHPIVVDIYYTRIIKDHTWSLLIWYKILHINWSSCRYRKTIRQYHSNRTCASLVHYAPGEEVKKRLRVWAAEKTCCWSAMTASSTRRWPS